MKKFFSILIVAVMSLSMAACGGSGDPVEPEEPKEALNFYGETVIFRVNTSLTTSVLKPPLLESARGDLMNKRYDDVAEKYNCDLQVTEFMGATGVADISTDWLAGKRFGDFYDAGPSTLYPLWKLGEINPISNVWDSQTLYSGKWGSKAILDTITFDGSVLGVKTGYWGVPVPNYDGVLYINNVLLSNFSQSHPFELAESGLWDWDHFTEICENVTQDDGEIATYGIIGNIAMYNAAVYSNGGRYVQSGADGSYSIAFTDTKFAQALEWIAELNQKGVIKVNAQMTDFAVDDKAAFAVNAVWYGYRINDEKTWPMAAFDAMEYSWMVFPAGPSASEQDKISGGAVLQDRFVVITNEEDNNPEDIATVIDAIFEPLDGETPTSWLEQFRRDFFFESSPYISTATDNSYTYYENMLNNCNMDDTMFIPNSKAQIQAAMASVVNGNKSVTEALSVLASTASAELAEETTAK